MAGLDTDGAAGFQPRTIIFSVGSPRSSVQVLGTPGTWPLYGNFRPQGRLQFSTTLDPFSVHENQAYKRFMLPWMDLLVPATFPSGTRRETLQESPGNDQNFPYPADVPRTRSRRLRVSGSCGLFQQGVNENIRLHYPTISDAPKTLDEFHVLTLTHRKNGFIAALEPFCDHLCSILKSASYKGCADLEGGRAIATICQGGTHPVCINGVSEPSLVDLERSLQ